MKNMKDLPNEDKPAYGQKVNELRQTIQSELDERQKLIKEEKLNQQLLKKQLMSHCQVVILKLIKTSFNTYS